jgi:hypothetical protein
MLKVIFFLETWNYHIHTYLSFIQHRNPEIVCNPNVDNYSWVQSKNTLQDPKLVYSNHLRWISHKPIGSSFCLGWMRGTFECNNLSLLSIPLNEMVSNQPLIRDQDNIRSSRGYKHSLSQHPSSQTCHIISVSKQLIWTDLYSNKARHMWALWCD